METLDDWLDALKQSDKHIIVEGIKDKRALVKLGVSEENITHLKGPLFGFVERIAKEHKKIILLTDLDEEGKKLYMQLKKDFQKEGVEIDNKFREFLFSETKLSHIEGISTYWESQKTRF
ncbi:MAG: toprim domain-containing protein [Nanoarchaeota archaeon]|nr:toprim domain-containing protein [Nanoarchaeota archaeon]